MLGEFDVAFRRFDASLRASPEDRRLLVEARDEIVDVLSGATGLLRSVEIGSYRHQTEVAGSSWFDVALVLDGKPTSASKAADLILAMFERSRVAEGAQSERSGLLAPVRRGDAVDVGVVGSAGGVGVRLIPAFEAPAAVAAGGGDVVLLADAAKRWVASRIGARETLLNRIDDETLRPLIRLLLAWKHHRNVDIASYYLETVVVRQALQQPSFSMLWDVCWSFEQLDVDDLMNLPDVSAPTKNQKVRATASLGKRIEAGYPVGFAAAVMRQAVNAYLDDDEPVVVARLQSLFGPEFGSALGAEGSADD